MRGTKAKAIRELVAQINCDESETQAVARQIKKGRRYVEYFDADFYQPRYLDRLTGEIQAGYPPLRLRAVKL